MTSRLLKLGRAPIVRARRAWRRRREPHGLILGYHRIAVSRIDPWRLCVSPEHFAQHLETISDFADIVPLRKLKDRLTAGQSARPAVAITFDDGYADNLHIALPLLERFNAPATVFVCTAWTGRERGFWWDRLAEILFESEILPAGLELEAISFHWKANGKLRHDRDSLHQSLWRCLRDIEDDLREDILERLSRWAGHPADHPGGARPMTADEVRILAASPLIEIGAHSLTHRPLTVLSQEQQLDEIERSGWQCEQMTGTRPESFAYPFGDMAPETAAMARNAGYARACSQRADLVWQDTDPHQLPRIGMLDRDASGFARHVRREWLP